MATTTERMGLKISTQTDNLNTAEMNAQWLKIEERAALRTEVQEPFYLKAAAITGGNLVLTIGRGQANFLGTLVAKAADTQYTIPAPAVNTTYHLFIKSDGSFLHRTNQAEQAGAVLLWSVATANPVATGTLVVADRRGQLPGASARVVADSLTSHLNAADPHPVYATDAELAAHAGRTDNPHGTTAAQVGAVVSIKGVSNPGGNVDLVPGGSISIVGDNGPAKKVTISESHSGRIDNPHGVTAAQTGALVSVAGVSNPGGNINVIGDGITVTADDNANTVTLNATAASVGALVSVAGVTNPGGNVALVAGGAVVITPNNAAGQKSITISENHSNRTDNPHGTTAAQVGAVPVTEKGAAGGVATLTEGGQVVQDARTLGGKSIHTGTDAGTIPVRDGDGELPGNIKGSAKKWGGGTHYMQGNKPAGQVGDQWTNTTTGRWHYYDPVKADFVDPLKFQA